jgi:glc operon protein GlcG
MASSSQLVHDAFIRAPLKWRTSLAEVAVQLLAAFVIGVLLIGVLFQAALAADIVSQPSLTIDGAKNIAAIAISIARDKQAPGAAVAVVDAAGNLLYLERLDGTFAASATVSTGKARTAIYFKKPTRFFEETINKGRYAMLAVPEIAPFTPLMGGVPIEANGAVVGAIGVSGAASAQQDDEIATAAVEAFAKAHRTQAQVSFVPRSQVEAGFRADANLVTGETYRVNSSKRDGAGEAEVHLTDTDIFYVLEGSATFVTGGRVVAPRNTSSSEIRGSEIQGGDTRQIASGDVITIPRGVPHWFKQVNTPFKYYVVKTAG